MDKRQIILVNALTEQINIKQSEIRILSLEIDDIITERISVTNSQTESKDKK